MFIACEEELPSSYLRKTSQRHVYKGIDPKIIIKCVVEGVGRHIGFVEDSEGRGWSLGDRRVEEKWEN